MANPSTLITALASIDWTSLIQDFAGSPADVAKVEGVVRRIAIWSRQLELVDVQNPALCFVREMQLQSQHAAALIGIAFYKPAGSAMRTMVESALYYSYFRTHPVELATLVRDPKFYLGRSEIEEYHKLHTSDFSSKEQAFGLLKTLRQFYGDISAVVHGQIPGKWVTHTDLASLAHKPDLRGDVIRHFEMAAEITAQLFLCTVAPDLWGGFSIEARKEILKGLSAEKKATLGLALA